MLTSIPRMDGNLIVKREKLAMELLKGKQIATKLQTLLQEPVQQDNQELVSYEELAMQILESFTTSLSELSSYSEWHESTHPAVLAVDGSGSTGTLTPPVKDGRGCYKRRKSSDSWTTVTQTTHDGLAWRKYGQKKILNCEHPRCYFRCTHKYSQGCKATKQVQKQKEDPFMYQTIYINRHTCTGTHLNVDPDPVEANIISFQMKEESHTISDPSTDPIWQDILVESDNYRFGYQEVGSSFGSTASYMEVNLFDDLYNNFQFDELN